MVESGAQTVSKADLIEKIWHDSFIEEGNIPVHISKLRKRLGASKMEPFIETVSGVGYQLVSRVSVVNESEWEKYLAESGNVLNKKEKKEQPLDSIAVLPFQNVNEDKEFEYLAEGVTESLINHLSYISELKVIARNTVFRFKDSQTEAREIGEMLSVAVILTGRVRVIGENIIVGVELMKVSDGTQIWGQQFNQPFADIFEIQEKIAEKISEKLRVQIGNIKKKTEGQQSQNVKAYALYLKGRYFWVKKSVKDINTALKYFQDSIFIDTRYAASYTGLVDCFISLYQLEQFNRETALSLIKPILDQIAEFNENSLEICVTIGHAKLMLEWDWKNAEISYQKSQVLNSNNAFARYRYANYLALAGRFAESLDQHQKALLLDPLSTLINASLGRVFYFMEQYDNAIKQLDETLELDRENYVTLVVLGCALIAKERYAEALDVFQTAQKIQKTVETSSLICYAYALSGCENEARQVIRQLEYQLDTNNVAAANLAVIYVALGETDKALECLEKSYTQHNQDLLGIKVDPRLKPLRGHPQFQDLIRRIGIP